MSAVQNDELLEMCEKYKELPIVVASVSMADIMGLTSTYGKLLYCGDKRYENEDLYCVGDTDTFEGKSFFKSGGKMKYMSNIELVRSLLLHDRTQWGAQALCNAIRQYEEDVRWWDDIKKYNLQDQLNAKLREAVELEEDDESIFEVVEYRMQS